MNIKKKSNEGFYKFFADFVLGGLIIAVSGYFIRKSRSDIGGFIYGALPIGFVYLYILTYYLEGITSCRILSKEVFVASIFFILFVYSVYLLTPYGIWQALLGSVIIFIVACFYYLHLIKNKTTLK